MAIGGWLIIFMDELILEIDGVSGNWIYMVNSIRPPVGSSAYPLESGDLVTWQHI